MLGSRILKVMWSGELSNDYITAIYLCMSIAIMKKEIVDVNVRLNPAVRL